MKIICIDSGIDGSPKEPSFYLKPDSAVSKGNLPFFYPDYSNSIIAETGIVIKINRLGKNIAEKYAHRYFSGIGFGINLIATDILENCIKHHDPWGKAISMNGSFIISEFIPKPLKESIKLSLFKNNTCIIEEITDNKNHEPEKYISFLSKYMTLKIGDLIFAGAKMKTETLKINDELAGYFNDKEMIRCLIK